MKILITGFEPFGGEKINPSQEILSLLPSQLGKYEIQKLVLPTVRGKALEILEEKIKKERVDYLVCLGQAGGISEIHLEKVGINLEDYRIADNEGNQPIDEPVFMDGENAYFSPLPLKRMVKSIQKEGIDACLSYSAGTFLCNHLLYGSLYLAQKKYPFMKAGFIHVPFLPSQSQGGSRPFLPLEKMVQALIAALKVIDQEELVEIGGQIY